MSLSRTARRISLPALLPVVLAAALLAIGPGRATPAGASAGAAAAGGGHSARPVIVLEHGAWADASSWNNIISQLQRRGFTVYAPPNPLRGLPQDSAYLHQFLTQNAALQGKPIVLVGHSYGGAVITNAAVGDPEIRALVYVDAFIPARAIPSAASPADPAWAPTASTPCLTPAGRPVTWTSTSSRTWSPDALPTACPPARPRSSRPPSGRSRPARSPSRPGPRPGRPSRPGP